jgi:hydroxypyruvate reductase
VTLTDKQRTTRLLLRSGATINEINVVRKHLSVIKGGGLATSTRAKIVTLILSDVIGDDLGSIGSGPTVSDPSTFADAVEVLERYRIWRSVPAAVRYYLDRGRRGIAPETLKPGSRRVRSVHHQVIGNNRIMLEAVSHTAGTMGLRTILFSTAILGEASLAARQLIATAQRIVLPLPHVRLPVFQTPGLSRSAVMEPTDRPTPRVRLSAEKPSRGPRDWASISVLP